MHATRLFLMLVSLASCAATADDTGYAQDNPQEAAAGESRGTRSASSYVPGPAMLPCPVTVTPAVLAWVWTDGLTPVYVQGCIGPVTTVACPDWVAVAVYDTDTYEATVGLGPVPGRAGPLEGTCTIAGAEVPVSLDVP